MKFIVIFIMLLSSCTYELNANYDIFNKKPFKKIILWGHKMHSHTHSWIHWAFYRAFYALGYDTHWFNNQDCVDLFDFSNSLFITEGQVDQKIPLRSDCRYILHNCYSDKYDELIEQGNAIRLQVYTHKCKNTNVEKIDEFIYKDIEKKCIYMPWATDCLPHEIEENKKQVLSTHKTNHIVWIGTFGGGIFGNEKEIIPFKIAAIKDEKHFLHRFLYTSMLDNVTFVRESYMAPAIVGTWQLKEGYIPCRIFKNISYGTMGITNSEAVYEICNKKIVYNQDTEQLYHDAKKRIENMHVNELLELMDLIKEKHTYFNRIQHLFNFMHELKPLESI